MNSEPKLLTLILSHDEGPFKVIQDQGQDKTFVPSACENSTVLRYIGIPRNLPNRFRIIFAWRRIQYHSLSWSNIWPLSFVLKWIANLRLFDNAIRDVYQEASREGRKGVSEIESKTGLAKTIVVDTPEDWSLIGLKTLQAFKFVLQNYDFDYLFRTNTSSYLDTSALLETIRTLPKRNLYSGVIGRVFGDLSFASGAGVLMSRDVLERVCQLEKSWNHGLVDDIALGVIVESLRNPSVNLTALSRLDIPSLEVAQQTSKELIMKNYHFRCKSKSPNETVEIMKHLQIIKES